MDAQEFSKFLPGCLQQGSGVCCLQTSPGGSKTPAPFCHHQQPNCVGSSALPTLPMPSSRQLLQPTHTLPDSRGLLQQPGSWDLQELGRLLAEGPASPALDENLLKPRRIPGTSFDLQDTKLPLCWAAGPGERTGPEFSFHSSSPAYSGQMAEANGETGGLFNKNIYCELQNKT